MRWSCGANTKLGVMEVMDGLISVDFTDRLCFSLLENIGTDRCLKIQGHKL